MKYITVIGTGLLLWLTLPAFAENADVAAAPPLEPQVQNGVTYLTGGVGDREQARLRELEDDYNVRIALTRQDGAYLSAIHVAIEDAAGHPVIETTTRGPVLLAKLAPGRYSLRAEAAGRTTERRVIDVPKMADQVRLFVALGDSDAAMQTTKDGD